MEMSYLLGIAGGCLTAVLLLVCLCIYAIRANKCCFKGEFFISFSICRCASGARFFQRPRAYETSFFSLLS